MGQRAGSKVGAVLDTKNKVKDKANAVKENIKDMPTQTAYAVYSAKEKAKSSVSDFQAWHGAGTAVQTDGTIGKAGATQAEYC